MKILLLTNGAYWNDRGIVICAATSKTKLINWMKTNKPTFKRQKMEENRNKELYYEDEAAQE